MTRDRLIPSAAALLTLAFVLGVALQAALPTVTLGSVDALAPHIVGTFTRPTGFTRVKAGHYLVFDRGGHAVHRIDRALSASTRIVAIGHEPGKVIQPLGFSAAPDGSFVIADAPGGRRRIQVFTADGMRLRGFYLPGRFAPLVTLADVPMNGLASIHYDGRSIFLNLPETGALIVEYSIDGTLQRTIGALRPTGHETDADVHAALNTGIPLLHPGGGFYFVFQTGEPRFRRYAADGSVEFERVIQGRELDELRSSQPGRWPRRRYEDRELPIVPPLVRTAAVDGNGQLWVSLVPPFTYVFDENGDKLRMVQFRAAGLLTPASLSFAPDGRLLVTPGCYVFEPMPAKKPAQVRGDDDAMEMATIGRATI